MNNDNDLNLHSMTKLSGWLRHCLWAQELVTLPVFSNFEYGILVRNYSSRLSTRKLTEPENVNNWKIEKQEQLDLSYLKISFLG